MRRAEPALEEGPFRGEPKKLHDGEPAGNLDCGGSEGVFAEDNRALLPVGLEAYWQGVQRLEQRYEAAAMCEAADRAEQEHAERLAAAEAEEEAAAERAEQAPGAGRCAAADGGSSRAGREGASAAADSTAARNGGGGGARAVPGAEADVIDLCDSDNGEPATARAAAPAPAAKRPRTAPKSVPKAQAAEAAGAKTVSGTCELSPLARARHDGSAPLGVAAARASKAAADDASWMFGGDVFLQKLLPAADHHMQPHLKSGVVWYTAVRIIMYWRLTLQRPSDATHPPLTRCTYH